MPKLTKSASDKNYWGSYPHKAAKNRKARQDRHKKAHPNDEVAQGAGTHYRRKRPNKKNGWLTREQEQIFNEEFRGRLNLDKMTKGQQKEFIQMLAGLRRTRRAQSFQQINIKKDQNKKKLGYAYS